MTPGLEPLVVAVGDPVEQVGVVGPEAREQWQVLGPHHDRYRIELEQPEARHHPTQMTPIYRAGGAGISEPLGSERDATGLRGRKFSGHAPSASANATRSGSRQWSWSR